MVGCEVARRCPGPHAGQSSCCRIASNLKNYYQVRIRIGQFNNELTLAASWRKSQPNENPKKRLLNESAIPCAHIPLEGDPG